MMFKNEFLIFASERIGPFKKGLAFFSVYSDAFLFIQIIKCVIVKQL